MKLEYDEKSHLYHIDGRKAKSVTRVLREEGVIDYSSVPQGLLERSQKFGDAVHLATKLYDLSNLNEAILDHALRPYLDGWVKFLKDTGFIIESIEKPIGSKKYMFAGTPDRTGILYGKRTIVEIKSVVTMQKATALQTGGYEICYNEDKKFKDKIKKRIGVQLKGDGTPGIEPYDDKSDLSVFLAILTLNNWKEANLNAKHSH